MVKYESKLGSIVGRMKVGATIHMTEENLHRLILTAGEVAYDRCAKGQDWAQTRIELIDALVAVTRPLTNEEQTELIGGGMFDDR
jgi:hypothetical protein